MEKSLSGVFPPGFWREHKLPGVLMLLLGLSSALTCCRNNLFVSSVPQLRRKTQGRPNVHVQVSRTPVGAPSCPADDVGLDTPFHCGSVAPQHPFPSLRTIVPQLLVQLAPPRSFAICKCVLRRSHPLGFCFPASGSEFQNTQQFSLEVKSLRGHVSSRSRFWNCWAGESYCAR